MRPSSEDAAPPARWPAWLHALGGEGAAVHWQPAPGAGADARPVLTGQAVGERVLHLPSGLADRAALAAAAHAAAHWRFGGAPQPRSGLKPVQQVLFAVLEDARVEWLALQELPGLRALWLPFHQGEDAPAGNGFEALLARLARSLLEKDASDAHPWIHKARAAFFHADGRTLALQTPASVRVAASLLGNDIGQMRLPFNPRTYRVHALYRDDGSWLWQPEPAAPDSGTTLAAQAQHEEAGGARELLQPMQDVAPVLYPEWDARIGRYRADWCAVHTCTAPAAGGAATAAPGREARRLARSLARLRGRVPHGAGRAAHGEDFHAMALLDARLQLRAGRTPDPRVYRRLAWPPEPLAVLLLLDASASTGECHAPGRTVLQDLLAVALAAASGLEAAGHASALLSFCSRTRERVEVRSLKHWQEAADAPQVLARCRGQRSDGSTRMGAALRHAAAQAGAFARAGVARQPLVLLLTDGDAHDVDAPDPAYLLGDLRMAVAEAERSGVRVRCLQLAHPGAAAGLRRALGGRHAQLRSVSALQPALLPLLAG